TRPAPPSNSCARSRGITTYLGHVVERVPAAVAEPLHPDNNPPVCGALDPQHRVVSEEGVVDGCFAFAEFRDRVGDGQVGPFVLCGEYPGQGVAEPLHVSAVVHDGAAHVAGAVECADVCGGEAVVVHDPVDRGKWKKVHDAVTFVSRYSFSWCQASSRSRTPLYQRSRRNGRPQSSPSRTLLARTVPAAMSRWVASSYAA